MDDGAGVGLGLVLVVVVAVIGIGVGGSPAKVEAPTDAAVVEAKPLPWSGIGLGVYAVGFVVSGCVWAAACDRHQATPRQALAKTLLWPLVLVVAVVCELGPILRGR